MNRNKSFFLNFSDLTKSSLSKNHESAIFDCPLAGHLHLDHLKVNQIGFFWLDVFLLPLILIIEQGPSVLLVTLLYDVSGSMVTTLLWSKAFYDYMLQVMWQVLPNQSACYRSCDKFLPIRVHVAGHVTSFTQSECMLQIMWQVLTNQSAIFQSIIVNQLRSFYLRLPMGKLLITLLILLQLRRQGGWRTLEQSLKVARNRLGRHRTDLQDQAR